MLPCFATDATNAIPIIVSTPEKVTDLIAQQSPFVQTWLKSTQFRAEAGNMRLIPGQNGQLDFVLSVLADERDFWAVGALSALPAGVYYFADKTHYAHYALAWGLGAYQFSRYKKVEKAPAALYLPEEWQAQTLNIVSAIYLVRDLINTPTDDMGPTELAAVAEKIAKKCGATINQIVGDELLAANYASIHTVGRASDDAPRLVDIRFGDPAHPKVTIVGKGVCFDSGGLDLKSSANMLLMKKDMAGAALALGLAQMIMTAKLPIALRVLLPIVENAVSGNAYRPGDIIKSRKGITVEIGNTDAEGRVVLSDALTEAVSEKPALLIDLSTLTGAARVAVGADIAAVFSNDNALVNEVLAVSEKEYDFMWRLPLHKPYRESLTSPIADINNCGTDAYAGAITAALFLQEFVPDDVPWLHFDMMAWNLRARPGRPQGGEAMAIRALFVYLQKRFQ